MQKFKSVEELVYRLRPVEPVYCIRKKSIQLASKYFQNKFPGKILYALKTNPNLAVLKTIVESGINSFDVASIKEIETLNILNASLLAMKRAIKKLKVKPNLVLVDGNKSPDLNNYITKTIIKGDQKIKEISAASIVAKVSRDKMILKMSERFKKYKWDLNAGYGTKDHLNAIRKYGITRFHRKTFNPIHNILSLKRK